MHTCFLRCHKKYKTFIQSMQSTMGRFGGQAVFLWLVVNADINFDDFNFTLFNDIIQ